MISAPYSHPTARCTTRGAHAQRPPRTVLAGAGWCADYALLGYGYNYALLLAAQILFIERHTERTTRNLHELRQRLQTVDDYPIRYQAMEKLPVREQVRLAASVRVVTSAHGMGLTWLVMLPAERVRCAVLEIIPRGFLDALDNFRDWSYMAAVPYFRFESAHAPAASCLESHQRVDGRSKADRMRKARQVQLRRCGDMAIDPDAFGAALRMIVRTVLGSDDGLLASASTRINLGINATSDLPVRLLPMEPVTTFTQFVHDN